MWAFASTRWGLSDLRRLSFRTGSWYVWWETHALELHRFFSWLLLQPCLCVWAVERAFTWTVCWEILSANRLAMYPWHDLPALTLYCSTGHMEHVQLHCGCSCRAALAMKGGQKNHSIFTELSAGFRIELNETLGHTKMLSSYRMLEMT